MIRKDAWVMRLYSAFCKKGKVEKPFPLLAPLVCGFLYFLAVACGYALNGLEQVVLPSLRHLQIDHCGGEEKDVVAAMKRTIRVLRTNPKVCIHGRGKQPLCSFDVAQLISRIPDRLSCKLKDASLFLFALHTGARALTCENVTWGDILRVDSTDQTTGVWRVIVLERVTKGNPSWDHPVCLEGWPERKHPLDVVYYLNQYSISVLNKNLREVTEREHGKNEYDGETVWQLSREAMRERIKKRLRQCGFPAALWSFHSFRSGHICSALLAAGSDPGKRGNILDVTAIVAGWRARGKAQRGYVKHVAEKQIVCSRLLGLGIGLYHTTPTKQPVESQQTDTTTTTAESQQTETTTTTAESQQTETTTTTADSQQTETDTTTRTTPSASSYIYSANSYVAAEGYIQTPRTTEEFHCIRLNQPNFSIRMYFNDLRKRFAKHFPQEGSHDAIKRHRINCFNRVLVEWGKKKSEGDADYKTLLRIGRTMLVDRLVDGDDPKSICSQMINQVLELHMDPNQIPEVRKYKLPRQAKQDINRSMVTGRTGKISRHRVFWTEQEDKLLIDARKAGKLFADIRDQLAEFQRTSEDACQRWRVLVRKDPTLRAYTNPRLKKKHA